MLERGDKPEEEGLMYKWGCFKGESKVYFSDLQSFYLAIQDSHPSLYCTKAWYHLYISDPFW